MNIIKKPLFLLMTIDKTGSMDEYVSDKSASSKMDYMKATMKNIIRYLINQETDIYIKIISFNTEVDIIVDTVKIDSSNTNEIIDNIYQLIPESATDIGSALITAENILIEYNKKFPTHEIGHIFMTDGQPTAGVLIPDKLVSYINDRFTNIFIGFGKEHNTKLLRLFSDKKNTDYCFVDHFENTGLVYGECIHRFLYPAVKHMKIYIEYGVIYNWNTNRWEQMIEEDIIVGDSEKIYHLRIEDEKNVSVKIYGNTDFHNKDSIENSQETKLIDIVYLLPQLVDFDGNKTELSDLTKYMFRQKIQELLYETTHNKKIDREEQHTKFLRAESMFDFHNEMCNYDEGENEIKIVREKTKKLFQRMKEYMKTNNLENDPFMSLLCDDLYVLFKTYGKQNGTMYLNARHISQGKQKIYNTSSQIHENEEEHVSFETRQKWNEDTIEYYKSSNRSTTCYASPTALMTMHTISQSIDEEFELI